jgi:hypothetical protein
VEGVTDKKVYTTRPPSPSLGGGFDYTATLNAARWQWTCTEVNEPEYERNVLKVRRSREPKRAG